MTKGHHVTNYIHNVINILLSRYVGDITGDHLCGFRRNGSTTDRILCFHRIQEINEGTMDGSVHKLFIDFKKLHDSFTREALYNIPIEFHTDLHTELFMSVAMHLYKTDSVAVYRLTLV
jgi:hypothetical protein